MHDKSRKKYENVDELIISDLGVNKESRSKKKNQFNFKYFNVKSFVIAVLIVIVVVTAIFLFRFVSFNTMVLNWRTTLTRESSNINNKSVLYSDFRNGIMRISNDGATYVDGNGNVIWTISYNIKDPIFTSKNKYFAIADKNGNNFYIFDDNGLVGENTTTSPIIDITSSVDGVLYIMQSDDNNSYINAYRANGTPIDLAVKTNLTEDGMPIDISTSDSGEELLVSYVCLDGDVIYTKATYYNFADAGKNANVKRIVGEFKDEFKDEFLARVHFFNDEKSCLIYDGGSVFVSTADPARPRVTNTVQFEDAMNSISLNEKYFAVILENNKLVVTDDSGSVLCERNIDFVYTDFYLNDDYVIFLNDEKVIIYDVRGRLIFDNEISKTVEFVGKKNSIIFKELLVGLIDGVECIRFY